MLLALAVFVLHPQLAGTMPRSANKTAVDATTAPAAPAESTSVAVNEEFLPLAPVYTTTALPAAEESAELPEEPLPLTPVAKPEPIAFISASRPMTVSVQELRAENRSKLFMWRGLALASSGAATFDAWTTRRAITRDGAVELDPMLKPFAGNASLYAAVQVGPVLMDYIGRKMMYSRHSWMRRAWWVPQSASFVTSMFCGAHNLAYH